MDPSPASNSQLGITLLTGCFWPESDPLILRAERWCWNMNPHPPSPGTNGYQQPVDNISSLSPLGRMTLRCVLYPGSQSAPAEASSTAPRGNCINTYLLLAAFPSLSYFPHWYPLGSPPRSSARGLLLGSPRALLLATVSSPVK